MCACFFLEIDLKMPGYCDPPNRFSSTNQPINRHTNKGPYFLPLLKKFLNKKIRYIDPETDKKIKGRVKDAVLWRLILNATQGDNHAIIHILDRVDGKVAEIVKLEEKQEALVQEEIELIPENGNGKLNRIKAYLKKQNANT